MRELTDHKVNPVNDTLIITVLDEPGSGGACHDYEITWASEPGGEVSNNVLIPFQNGGIAENGVNGITHEALLAIVIDRLRSFQNGSFPCMENAEALSHVEQALDWLKSRTRARMARGVEGKTVP